MVTRADARIDERSRDWCMHEIWGLVAAVEVDGVGGTLIRLFDHRNVSEKAREVGHAVDVGETDTASEAAEEEDCGHRRHAHPSPAFVVEGAEGAGDVAVREELPPKDLAVGRRRRLVDKPEVEHLVASEQWSHLVDQSLARSLAGSGAT